MEGKKYFSAKFVTLTYDTEFVPLSPTGFMTLKKRDVQLYIKRVRRAHTADVVIKYFAVGEYGGKTWRPHYHLIVFGADVEILRKAWRDPETGWPIGHVHFGDVSEASIGYTLKYISKPCRVPQHQNDDRLREFRLMSKGIGANYLTKGMVNWHRALPVERMYCNLKDGKKISMPRYYKQRIWEDNERKIIGVKVRHAMKKDELEGEELHNKIQNDLAAFKKMNAADDKNKI